MSAICLLCLFFEIIGVISLRGNKVCKLNTTDAGKEKEYCCYGFIEKDDYCVPCPSGRFGLECAEICPTGFYGPSCMKECECRTEMCSPIHGCKEDQRKVIETIVIYSALGVIGVVILLGILRNKMKGRSETWHLGRPDPPSKIDTDTSGITITNHYVDKREFTMYDEPMVSGRTEAGRYNCTMVNHAVYDTASYNTENDEYHRPNLKLGNEMCSGNCSNTMLKEEIYMSLNTNDHSNTA